MSSIRIRKAREEDVPAIVAFTAALARETEHLELDAAVVSRGVKAVLDDRRKGFYIVAEREGVLTGQVLVTFEWSDWRNQWYWWLQSVYVDPASRRQGVFSGLFAYLRALAVQGEGPVHSLKLYVNMFNRDARQTYAKQGFNLSRHQLYEFEMLDATETAGDRNRGTS